MSVFTHPAPAPVDIICRRSQDNQHCIRWQRKDLDTGELAPAPIPAEGMKAHVQIFSPLHEIWLEYDRDFTKKGMLLFAPSHDDLSGEEWENRPQALYQILVTVPARMVLAHGNMKIEP